jgi:hypothetical protein
MGRRTYGMCGGTFCFCTVVPPPLSPALTDARDLGPLVSAWVWHAHGAGTKRRTQWATAYRGWNPSYGSILLLPSALISFASYTSWFLHSPRLSYRSILLLPSALISFASYTSWFLHSPRPSFTAMATELPPSWFKTTGSLASLRRLMGWQAPGPAPKLKHRAALLANMRSGDFVFFAAYALAGLVTPLSYFLLTLLEYYRLQLQHLSPNSIVLVVIFVHLCEMFEGV